MPLFKATIDVLIDCETETEACDCLAETLRPLLREFSQGGALIDWRYAGPDGDPSPDDGAEFEYGSISPSISNQGRSANVQD